MTSATVTRRGHWGPGDREASVYQYVPFEVASGTSTVEVRLSYDRSAGAVLDLGLFSPTGFRGYSGGARDRFVVTPTGATPGYIPGEVDPGQWTVLLGLYRLPPQGTEWEIAVATSGDEMELAPPPPAPDPSLRPPPRRLPARSGRRWAAGDLHTHTVHSDGSLTIEELANTARAEGLDFLAVTDHNTVSHHRWLAGISARYDIDLLAGQEVTTGAGHANCLGEMEWVDFRRPPDEWLLQAEEGGGLLSINHPVLPTMDWQHHLESAPHLVEMWHWTWDRVSEEPLAWSENRGGTPVAGSDFHSPHEGRRLGEPTTYVEVEDGDVLAGLRAGRVALAASPAGPAVVRHGDELTVVDGEGLRVIGPDGRETAVTSGTFSASAESGLHRLVDPDGHTVAMTP